MFYSSNNLEYLSRKYYIPTFWSCNICQIKDNNTYLFIGSYLIINTDKIKITYTYRNKLDTFYYSNVVDYMCRKYDLKWLYNAYTAIREVVSG